MHKDPTTQQSAVIRSPFIRLADLLADLSPAASPVNLSVGEPQHAIPSFVADVLAANVRDFNRYPLMRGTDAYREAVASWAARRYPGVTLDAGREVIVLNGSREGLFFAALAAATYAPLTGRKRILMPNPFYPVYAGAASCANLQPVLLGADAGLRFLPDLASLSPAMLDDTAAFFLCSPANPQGAIASRDYLEQALQLARKHGFLLFCDECYSEIYSGEAPTGGLEVARATGSHDNLVVFNSLSKRSNLAGLRCGFAAGDGRFLEHLTTLRNVVAPQVPMPVQAVGAAAWSDEAHVVASRALYQEKFALAQQMLGHMPGFAIPEGGFFLWLNISHHGSDEAVTRKLWAQGGIRVVPGSYLAVTAPDGSNPGAGYVRIALVQDLPTTREALSRLVAILT